MFGYRVMSGAGALPRALVPPIAILLPEVPPAAARAFAISPRRPCRGDAQAGRTTVFSR